MTELHQRKLYGWQIIGQQIVLGFWHEHLPSSQPLLYQAEIDKIQAEWDQVAQTIPDKPLEIFKRVTETYDG